MKQRNGQDPELPAPVPEHGKESLTPNLPPTGPRAPDLEGAVSTRREKKGEGPGAERPADAPESGGPTEGASVEPPD
ncbi:hypothetical protein ACFWHQ_18515 [Streptomyces sp. NPDC060334]|uniref:hypothetical protein n=1 Tax=unclassified Streptomyces TaxID=2593676 RepID=UPI000AADC51E|nr:hypothetical protein [Streptomyces sp. WM4235]